jgi:hypothetical protein
MQSVKIIEQTNLRWRKEYGRLQVDQPKRLMEFENGMKKIARLS